MRARRGVTLAELIIGLPLGLLIAGMIFQLFVYMGRVYDSAVIHSGADQQLSRIADVLQEKLNTTAIEGVGIGTDRKTLAIQSIRSITSSGHKRWNNGLTVFYYDEAAQTLYQHSATLEFFGIVPNDKIPQKLQPADVDRLATSASQGKVLATNVVKFEIVGDLTHPTLGLEIGVETKNRRGKIEKVYTQTHHTFMSSLDV